MCSRGRARESDFSIDECRELLSLYEDQQWSSADLKRIATRRLEENAKKQRKSQSLHDDFARLVDVCHSDGRPDCPFIDGLGNRHAGGWQVSESSMHVLNREHGLPALPDSVLLVLRGSDGSLAIDAMAAAIENGFDRLG